MNNNVTAPMTLSEEQRMWKAVRALRAYTTRDLVLHAGVERQKAINFCRFLIRCGLAVRETVTRTLVRGRLPHYCLVKDPGPELPIPAPEVGGRA